MERKLTILKDLLGSEEDSVNSKLIEKALGDLGIKNPEVKLIRINAEEESLETIKHRILSEEKTMCRHEIIYVGSRKQDFDKIIKITDAFEVLKASRSFVEAITGHKQEIGYDRERMVKNIFTIGLEELLV